MIQFTSTLAIDLETSSWYGNSPDPHRDTVHLISICNGQDVEVLEPGDWLPQLWAWLNEPDHVMIAHNAEFDLRFLWSLGYTGYPRLWDTLLIERVLTAGQLVRRDLQSTLWRRCNILIDKKDLGKSFKDHIGAFTDAQLEYSKNDVLHLHKLQQAQERDCKKLGLMETVELENALVPAVAAMEYLGVGFNTALWGDLVRKESYIAKEAEQKALRLLPCHNYTMDLFSDNCSGINIGSNKQVTEALYELGIRVEDTQEDTLLEYLRTHPSATVLRHLIDYRKATKRIGFNYPSYINPMTGRIHTQYNQVGPRSGRFSSSDPNLQNVPASKEYRAPFREPEYLYVTVDFAQQEHRITAQASGDKNLQRVCRELDVHCEIARLVYNDKTITKSDPRRRVAKGLGLGMSYGAGAETIANGAGISSREARRVVKTYRTLFSTAEAWSKHQIQMAQEEGYVKTLGGRIRWFLDVDPNSFTWQNSARNSPIQGTAADMMKRAILYVDTALRKYDADIVLTVHDELVVRVRKGQEEEVVPIIVREMERAGQYYVNCVPTPVDVAIEECWAK